MTFSRAGRCTTMVAGLLLLAPSVRADEPAPPESLGTEARKEVADRLFQEAHRALDAKDWELACGKFRASMRYDISVSTQLNIARCHEHEGDLLKAWRDYNRARLLNRETADEDRRQALGDYLERAAAKVEARLGRLRVVVTNAPAGLSIASDGARWSEGLGGAPVPLNPGAHTIVVQAPGYRTVTRQVELVEGGNDELVVTLEPAPQEKTPPPAPIVAARPTLAPEPLSPPPEPASTPVWIWPVGGAGLVALGVGIGFAVDSANARAELSDRCQELDGGQIGCPSQQFDQEGVDGLESRANLGLGLGVGLGVAGLGAIAGAVVGASLGSGGEELAVRVGPARIEVAGRF